MKNVTRVIIQSPSLLLLLFGLNGNAQTLFYSDQFNGGVTCGGYSPDYGSGGTGTFDIYIPSGSAIHQAYLFAGRHGNASNLTVQLNGNNLTFNSSNQVSLTFQSPFYGGNSGVHAIDVTGLIDSSVNTYMLIVPLQSGPSDRYNDFYLYVAYKNSSLPSFNTSIFLNEYDLTDSVTWTLALPYGWNTGYDAAISLFTGYSCSNGDGESVSVDGTYLGDYFGPEINSGSCGGPLGNFYYDNGTLTGLGDDDANSAMAGADVISNVNGIVSNGNLSCSILFDSQSGNPDNALWAVVIANGGGCPTASVNPDTLICFGSGVQLSATGGTNFSWYPATGLSNPDIANPFANPDTSTLYVVTASDSSAGCTSMDSVFIGVVPPGFAGPDAIVCKSDSAQLSAFGGSSYSWQPTTGLSDPNISNPKCYISTTTTFTVTIIDSNGCVTTDELLVSVVPTVTPPAITQDGNVLTCGLEVSYQWKLNTVEIPGATNQTYTITVGGFYSCAVITNSGCPTESSPFYATPVGLDDLSLQPSWEIYPNPAADELFISSSEINSVIRVLNTLGQEIISLQVLRIGIMMIDVKDLEAGIYYVELMSENNAYMKKWVKK